MADSIFQPMRFTIDLDSALVTQTGCGWLIYGDKLANVIEVKVLRGGKTIDMTGMTATGAFYRPVDGAEVPLPGTISANMVSVQLIDECYETEGHYEAEVKLSQGEVRRTILSIVGYVHHAGSGTVVNVTGVVPSIPELLAQISAMKTAAERANTAAARAEALAINASGYAQNAKQLNGKDAEYYATAESVDQLSEQIAADGAGAHNSIYRGKYLGSAVTDSQYAAIADGTFNNLFIGDYWTINGINYRIAAFDYYLGTGDVVCITHHATIVPDDCLYNYVMNDSLTTENAYAGSKMRNSGLESAKSMINDAFGSAHILSHRVFLQNATTDGYASAGGEYDSTVELMSELNVYGCNIFGGASSGASVPFNYTYDKTQYPLFAFRPDAIPNGTPYWLRDVVSVMEFANVYASGYSNKNNAVTERGVRPAFSIIG